MANNDVFFGIIQAIMVDGRYTSGPNQLALQDLNTDFLNVILCSRCYNADQIKVDAFEYNYGEPKRKKNTVIFFPRPVDGNSNITALKAWYDAHVVGNKLTKYTKLICIDKIHDQKIDPTLADYTDILVNDFKVVRRELDPAWQPVNSQGAPFLVTHLYVHMGKESDLKIFTVLGDQTVVGGYYEEYYG